MAQRCFGRAALVVALCSFVCLSQDVPNMEEEEAERPGEEGRVRPTQTSNPDSDLATMADKWEGAIRSQSSYNQMMADAIRKPRVPDGPVQYTKIPWFAMKAGAIAHKDFNQGDCELECSKYNACKSFSYNLKKKVCLTSYQGMGYDPDYTFYSKKQGPGGTTTAEYEQFPGMKFEVNAQVVRRGGSEEQCEFMCSSEKDGCTAFSYAEKGKVCMRTSEPLHYDDEFNYFEKTTVSGSAVRDKEEVKENDAKNKQKKMWERRYEKRKTAQQLALTEAIEDKEAHERFVKEGEKEMEAAAHAAKESEAKTAIAEKRKQRFARIAKEKGGDAEQLEAQDRMATAKKELAEKKVENAKRQDDGPAQSNQAVEAKVEAEKAKEVEKEESKVEVQIAEVKQEEEGAAQEEVKDEIAQHQAQVAKTAADNKAADEKLEFQITQIRERILEAKRSRQAARAAAKERTRKERAQKRALAEQQAAVERKQKKCFAETTEDIRKEICEKSQEAAATLRQDEMQEADGAAVTADEASDGAGIAEQIEADEKKMRELKVTLGHVKREQRQKKYALEASEKAKIAKENAKKKEEFMERKEKLKHDQDEEHETQVLEVKSKQSQIRDMREKLAARQANARQEKVLESVHKKFIIAYREEMTSREAAAAKQNQAPKKQAAVPQPA